MDSVVMTTPSSAAKIRARVRSAFSAVCSRPLRKSQKNNNAANNRQAVAQRVTQQQTSGGSSGGRHGEGGNSRQRSSGPAAVTGKPCTVQSVAARHATKRNTPAAAAPLVTATRHHLATEAGVTPAQAKQTSCPVIEKTGRRTINTAERTACAGIISEALSVWKPRSPSQPAPPDTIQCMFNQMQLYPTRKQVQEMLQTSRRCASALASSQRRPGCNESPASDSSPVAIRNTRTDSSQPQAHRKRALGFAEFCVFAAELRRLDRQPSEALKNKKNSLKNSQSAANERQQLARNINSVHKLQEASQTNLIVANAAQNANIGSSESIDSVEVSERVGRVARCEREYEVFLGGSCNPTTWRTDKAIPALDKLGITYYNPQVSHWSPELIEIEYRAKQCARVMFFVMDDETRSTAGSVEVAQIAAELRSLVLVVRPYRPDQSILNEKLSPQEYMDLSRNQQILQELVESRGLPVLSNIDSALTRTKQLINNEIVSTVQTNGADVSAKLIELRSVFNGADVSRRFITIQQCTLALSQLGITTFDTEINQLLTDLRSHMNDSVEDSYGNKNAASLDFPEFCALTAELMSRPSTKHTDTDKDNANDIEWVNKQVIYRQSSSNNNTVDNCHLNGRASDFLCVYAPKVADSTNHRRSADCPKKRDIYLGGSCMLRTRWRQNVIIPMLEERGVSFHVPKLHESLVKIYSNYDFPPVFENDTTSALSMSIGSDKSETNNRPGKRVKYDDVTSSKSSVDEEQHRRYDGRASATETVTKADLTINLIDIDRSSSGSSISTVSSLNSPLSAAEEPLANYKDFHSSADFLEDFALPDDGCLYNPALIEGSRVLLFYISKETRSLAPMTLAAFCIGEGRKVVLCIEMLSENAKIGSEQLTRTAIKDFNRGRAYLADMARREGVSVYEDIVLATEKAIEMVKEEQ